MLKMNPLSSMLAAAIGIALAGLIDGVSSFAAVPLCAPSGTSSFRCRRELKETHVGSISSLHHQRTLCRVYAEADETQPSPSPEQTPLIDLQTFLKLCGLVSTGGEAKAAIQGEKVRLNWAIETRRAKKLFAGDEVSFGDQTLDVSDEVTNRGYVYKVKTKKAKPKARVMDDGSLEFGGRYRSEEWRAERKQKKADRKRNAAKEDVDE